jgi:hypothetical protein
MKISFDFDGTLSETKYQTLAKSFIDIGIAVFITTSRSNNYIGHKVMYDNTELYEIAKNLGIPFKNIRFTHHEDKCRFMKGMDLHFDDDEEEIFLINSFPNTCIGLLIG